MATLTLHNGDCLEIMKNIPANSIDLIICDLPYGCLANDGKNKMSAEKAKQYGRTQSFGVGCNWDVKIDLVKFWEQAKRILKNEHSPVIHFCTTKFGYELIKSNESWFRYDLVWDKQRGVSFLQANKMPMRSHEMIYVFSKAGAYYNRVDISGNFKQSSGGRDKSANPSAHYGALRKVETNNEGKRCVLSVIEKAEPKIHKRSATSNVYPKVKDMAWANKDTDTRCAISVIKQPGISKKGGHPTEKPVDLYRWLIERYCPPDGTVLDPTFGSANSVFTAFEMGRTAIGIEKDKAFYDKANERKKALLPKNEIV